MGLSNCLYIAFTNILILFGRTYIEQYNKHQLQQAPVNVTSAQNPACQPQKWPALQFDFYFLNFYEISLVNLRDDSHADEQHVPLANNSKNRILYSCSLETPTPDRRTPAISEKKRKLNHSATLRGNANTQNTNFKRLSNASARYFDFFGAILVPPKSSNYERSDLHVCVILRLALKKGVYSPNG